MKKHYGGSNILFLESGALSMSLEICFAFLNTNLLTFGKVLNIWEESQ